MTRDPVAERWKEHRLAEIDRRWEEQKREGISWYVLDVADLRRYLREAEEENRRLRERLDRLESGLRALVAEMGGDSHETADMRHLPMGQSDG